MSYSVEWQWDASQLDRYGINLSSAAAEVARSGAEIVMGIAQDSVAVDTGSLKDTIDYEVIEVAPGSGSMSVNAGDTSGGYKGGGKFHDGGKREGEPVDYAIDQEYGSARVSGTPFMTPASEEGWVAYQERAAEILAALQ